MQQAEPRDATPAIEGVAIVAIINRAVDRRVFLFIKPRRCHGGTERHEIEPSGTAGRDPQLGNSLEIFDPAGLVEGGCIVAHIGSAMFMRQCDGAANAFGQAPRYASPQRPCLAIAERFDPG